MKKRITRGLIALLAIVMCAATAQAQTTPTSGTAGPLTWKYDTDTKTLTISGKGEMPNYDREHPAPWQEHSQEMLMLVVEEEITGIGDFAFQGAGNLISASLPKTLTRIGNFAFGGCRNLALGTLPAALQEIGEGAFIWCENLSMVVFPDGMIRIGFYAFGYCSSLSFVTLPSSVKAIGESAFFACKNLKSLTVGIKTPPDIDKKHVFDGVPVANVTLTVPKGSKAAYAAAPVWKEFKQISESTVANAAVPEARIYAAEGLVYLTLPQAATVRIYNLNGVLVRSLTAPAGLTTVALPEGIYIVRAGEHTEKVFVN